MTTLVWQKFLLAHKANINAQDKLKATSLNIAVQNKQKNVARFLIESGADVNIAESGGFTPLHYAVLGDVATTEFLLKHGADIYAKNSYGETPVDKAIEYGNEWILRLLKK